MNRVARFVFGAIVFAIDVVDAVEDAFDQLLEAVGNAAGRL